MVDNVPITAGSGTTIATDDIGGVHYQVVKLALGGLDSATLMAIPTAIYNGQNTVAAAGTAEALAASQALQSGVTVKALAGNTGSIFVGSSGVTSANGFVLAPGEQIFLEVANLATVYIDAATTGDGVSYIGS